MADGATIGNGRHPGGTRIAVGPRCAMSVLLPIEKGFEPDQKWARREGRRAENGLMFAIAEYGVRGQLDIGRILPVIFASEEKARFFLNAFLKQPSASADPGAYEITPVRKISPGKCPFHAAADCPVRFRFA